MAEPNSFVDPEFLKDLQFVTDALSANERAAKGRPTASGDGESDFVDGIALEKLLTKVLEQACEVTGATGAAIALGQGDEMVCRASTGKDAPDVGIFLDPLKGLSGACIRTRLPQLCSDTETNPHVDAAACRELGVRSIIVLPVMLDDELIGLLELLSARPNAFFQRDFESLTVFTDQILEVATQGAKSAPSAPAAESFSVPKPKESVRPPKSQPSDSGSASPRERRPKRDIWTPILGALIICAAVLLGAVVGWRMGWQRATLGVRGNAPSIRVTASAKSEQNEQAVPPTQMQQSSFAPPDKCGQAANGTQARRGGELTVCKEGRVVFSLPPTSSANGSAPAPQGPPGSYTESTQQ